MKKATWEWSRAGTVRELYETKGGALKHRDVPAWIGPWGGRMSRHAARVATEGFGFRAVFKRAKSHAKPRQSEALQSPRQVSSEAPRPAWAPPMSDLSTPQENDR